MNCLLEQDLTMKLRDVVDDPKNRGRIVFLRLTRTNYEMAIKIQYLDKKSISNYIALVCSQGCGIVAKPGRKEIKIKNKDGKVHLYFLRDEDFDAINSVLSKRANPKEETKFEIVNEKKKEEEPKKELIKLFQNEKAKEIPKLLEDSPNVTFNFINAAPVETRKARHPLLEGVDSFFNDI